ncbi:MAG TPA: T6SS effector BTH_I2691 family protein [Thiobacillus sp.]
MTQQTDPSCEFCDKRGLPILPVRYATAPRKAGAPETRTLDADGKALPGLGDHAHYTRRLLRSGYLYVYDEARKRWEGYFITNSAHFMRFQVGKPIPSAFTGDKKPCDRTGHPQIAGMITISDPKNASRVWLGFSDVEWTEAVLLKHEAADYRKKHMQVVDVKKALAQGKQPNVHAISEIGTKIAEYACDPAKAQTADGFKYTPFDFSPRKPQIEETLAAANALRKNAGIILSLHDPAGVAIELSTSMSQHFDAFTNKPAYQHPLAVSSAIVSLQQAMAHQAELDEIDAGEYLANDMMSNNPLGYAISQNYRDKVESIRATTPAELKKATDNSWKKYAAKYSEPKRIAFQNNFDQALARFDEAHIVPLAFAHAAWMQSKLMANYFEANFDSADAHSGLAYLAVLSLCIGATQDKKACFDVYADWLMGDATDKANLLLRGLVLNQDEVATIITKGSANATNPKSMPWDGMVGSVGTALGHVIEGKPDLLGKFIVQISGPLSNVAKQFVQNGALPHALIAAGIISKKAIVRIEIKGNMQDFQKYLITELMREQTRAQGKMKPPHGIKAAIKRELKLLEIKGGKLAGTRSKRFLALVDLEALKGLPQTDGQRKQAQALAKTIANINDLEALELGRWHAALARGTTVGKTAAPFAFAGLGAVLQLVSLSALSEELDKATQEKKGVTEAQWRYSAGVAALAGTTADTLGTALGKMSPPRFKYGAGITRLTSKIFTFLGKTLGVAGAAIIGVFDWQKSNEAMDKNQIGLAWAYRASALMGVSGAVIMLMGGAMATGIGLILVLLAIGLSLLIDFIRDNPIQEWLEAGYFQNQTFKTPEEELNKLKAIAS